MAFIIGIILGGAAVLFAFQNTAAIVVSFFGHSFEGSVAGIVILSILVGIVISLLFSLPAVISSAVAEKRLRKHNEQLARELEDHKIKLAETNAKLEEKPTERIIIT